MSEWKGNGLDCVLQIRVRLESQIATLFGNKVFADVIKLRWSYIGVDWALNTMTDILKRRVEM